MLKLDEPPEETETVKQYIENVLTQISKLERDLFSYSEVENMLLDIYNVIVSQ